MVAAVDIGPTSGGDVIECFLERAETPGAALDVGNGDERPDLFVVGGDLLAGVEGTVGDGVLEIGGAGFAAGVDEPRFAEVVLREAPLAAVGCGGFLDDAAGRPTDARRRGRGVDPVIGAPDEPAGLVLEIGALRLAVVKEPFGVGDAVAIGVAVFEKVAAIGLLHEQTIAQRQQHAREQQPVDEDRVAVKNPVVFRRPMHRDAAGGSLLVGGVDVAHVGAHLCDKHAAVAVENRDGGRADLRLAQDQLEPITGRNLEGFEGFSRREDGRPRLGRERARRLGRAQWPQRPDGERRE